MACLYYSVFPIFFTVLHICLEGEGEKKAMRFHITKYLINLS